MSSPLFGSLMPYILLPSMSGQPIIALRSDEKHYEHILMGERSSLLIYPLVPKEKMPSQLPLPRLNITGECKELIDPALVDFIIKKYECVHPGSSMFLKQSRIFHFYALQPQDIFYVLSTQEIEQFQGPSFINAKMDLIAKYSRELIDDFNRLYRDELIMMCEEYGSVKVSEAFVFSCDRRGFDILGRLVEDETQWYEFRLPLEREEIDIDNYRTFVEQAFRDLR